MSEKEKMKSEEIAKVLAENPTAKIYLAGLAQGMKLAKSMEPETEQPTPAGKEAANEKVYVIGRGRRGSLHGYVHYRNDEPQSPSVRPAERSP